MHTTTWTESDALYAAKKAPTLADLMLARGAQLAGPTPEQVEDVAVIDITEVPADAAGWTCSRGHYNEGNGMWCSRCPQ